MSQEFNDMFSTRRIMLLVRNDLIINYRSWLNTTAAIAGVIFILTIIFGQSASGLYDSIFTLMLFIMGIVMSSRAFKELYDKTLNESYLLLPTSALEKTLARLLLVTIGFVVYLLAFLTVLSIAISLITLAVRGETHFFNPFEDHIWLKVLLYAHIQAYFFLGSAWFKKQPLVKTIVALNLISFVFAIFGFLVIRILLPDSIFFYLESAHLIPELINSSSGILKVMAILVPALLSISCWVIAWQRVKEAQVSDGV